MSGKPPGRLLRLVFKLPGLLYQARLGWLRGWCGHVLASRRCGPAGAAWPRRLRHPAEIFWAGGRNRAGRCVG